MKETYRLNKLELHEKAYNNNIFLNILFSLNQTAYTNFRELNFSTLSGDMANLLKKISEGVYNK